MRDQDNLLPLTTERLLLRIPSPTDAQAMVTYYAENKTHLAPWEPIRSQEFYTLTFWNGIFKESEQDFLEGRSLRLLYSLNTQMTDTIIGVANFGNIVRGAFQACHLGYSLDYRYQGQGLMHEGLQHALAFALEHLQLHRIMANYMPRNERSGKLLRKLGFVPEGYARDYLKIAGKWEDHILTALTYQHS